MVPLEASCRLMQPGNLQADAMLIETCHLHLRINSLHPCPPLTPALVLVLMLVSGLLTLSLIISRLLCGIAASTCLILTVVHRFFVTVVL